MPSAYGSKSYSAVTQRGGSPRDTEGRALLEAARRMDEAAKSGDLDAMRKTARLNWRLWTIFQAELSDDKSPVPPELRANMLNLCNFVDKRTVALLASTKPEALATLVNINRQIAAGLLAAPGAAGPESAGDRPTPPASRGDVSV